MTIGERDGDVAAVRRCGQREGVEQRISECDSQPMTALEIPAHRPLKAHDARRGSDAAFTREKLAGDVEGVGGHDSQTVLRLELRPDCACAFDHAAELRTAIERKLGEQERDVDGDVLHAIHFNDLWASVIRQLEITRGQVNHGTTAVCDRNRHRHDVSSAAELHVGLLLARHRWGEPDGDRYRHRRHEPSRRHH